MAFILKVGKLPGEGLCVQRLARINDANVDFESTQERKINKVKFVIKAARSYGRRCMNKLRTEVERGGWLDFSRYFLIRPSYLDIPYKGALQAGSTFSRRTRDKRLHFCSLLFSAGES